MNFVARQRELMECLRWAPSRGPKRQALLAQLRLLVRDELEREVAGSATTPPRSMPVALIDENPVPAAEPSLYARRPYWIDP